LPEAVSPLKSETPRTESPLLRQTTGLSEKTKTMIEAEVDNLGIEFSSIYPRTGMPKADREISRSMGPVIEQLAPKVIDHENYQKLSEPMKRMVWAEIFSKARMAGREKLKETDPNLYRQIKYEGLKDDMKQILESRGFRLNK
jgi:hypothetical protein